MGLVPLPIYKGKALRTRLGTSFTETQEKGHFSFLFFFFSEGGGGGGGGEGRWGNLDR